MCDASARAVSSSFAPFCGTLLLLAPQMGCEASTPKGRPASIPKVTTV